MSLLIASTKTPLLSGFKTEDLQLLIDENPYLRGYIQGYLAESVLAARLRDLPGVSSVRKIPDADKLRGDLSVSYLGVDMVIECKSLASGVVRDDLLTGGVEVSVLCKNTDRRTIVVPGVGEVQSVNLPKGQFDILAICTYPITGEWGFLFMENKYLPEAENKPGFIKSRFIINTVSTPWLETDVSSVLNRVAFNRGSVK